MTNIDTPSRGVQQDEPILSAFSFQLPAIGLLLFIGLIIRLGFATLPGFGVDIGIFQFWSTQLAEDGPWNFYDNDFFTDYAPGEYCVFSSIHDASAVRYMLPIKVKALNVLYETTQRSPDGDETEMLQMRLKRKGEDLIATYLHTVKRRDATDLHFCGTTLFSAADWE